ncbi:CmeU family protein [Nitrosophilus alvini]|uniref:CmeU family protein n=1 Tax=Nitrosophilus alvini TaxID=2714855 RepID=UPI0019099426|nr:CmeU family protein [Nitrosophilus alvini]
MDKEKAMKELKAYEKIRNEFYSYLDSKIPKKENGMFDFENAEQLDAKEIYELFYKLDYQARKIRGMVVNLLGLKAE